MTMICALASIALTGKPGGGTALRLAKFFGYSWLPLVGFGILGRLTASKDEPPPVQTATPLPTEPAQDVAMESPPSLPSNRDRSA
jgi:hypothetical protein